MKAEKLLPFYIPSLCGLLIEREKAKGAPLMPDEVFAICAGANRVLLRKDTLEWLEKSRGYRDIELAQCWEQWQSVREQLQPGKAA